MPQSITSAMILAAGLGSRLRPLTDNMPKPLIKVGGQPIIQRAINLVAGAGIRRIVINTHYMAAFMERDVEKMTPAGVEILFSREEELLETGGGLKNALPLLGDGPFLVVNSDAVWREEKYPLLKGIMAAFDIQKHDALLGVVPITRTKDFQPLGDFAFNKTTCQLAREGERATWDVIYAGVHVTHPAFVAAEPEKVFSLNRIWNFAREEGRLHGYFYDAPWAEMGTHSGLLRAGNLLEGKD